MLVSKAQIPVSLLILKTGQNVLFWDRHQQPHTFLFHFLNGVTTAILAPRKTKTFRRDKYQLYGVVEWGSDRLRLNNALSKNNVWDVKNQILWGVQYTISPNEILLPTKLFHRRVFVHEFADMIGYFIWVVQSVLKIFKMVESIQDRLPICSVE